MPDPDPLSLQSRTRRIACRLQVLQQFIEWADHDNMASSRAGFWEGLCAMLEDVSQDVEVLRCLPFPLTEWCGESWKEFRAEYDQPAKR